MGSIALIGGDEFRAGGVALDRALLAATASAAPRVAIVPTAAAHQRPELAAANGVRHFAALGAQAEAVMLLARADADDAALLAPLRAVDLVYLTGGDPRHLTESLGGTLAESLLREALARGAVVAGSSAGAMALGAWWWLRGGGHAGLGVVPTVGVLPHHEGRQRDQVAAPLAARPAGLTLLGIDAQTGCWGDGSAWRVEGAGAVTVYGAADEARYTAGQSFALG